MLVSRLSLVSLATATLLLPVALPAQGQVQAYSQTVPRMATRIAWFSRTGSPGQVCIEYGTPSWKSEWDSQIENAKGKTFRLGSNFWTSLDTSVPLTIGGTEVPAGQWYLGLHCDDDGTWKLMVMDASKVREMKGDGVMTSYMKAKISAPLTYSKVDEAQDELHIELVSDPKQIDHATLRIHWGKHELSAPVVAKLDLDAKPGAQESKGDGEKGANRKSQARVR